MRQPSPSTFWRFIFATVSLFALFAFWSLVETTRQLGILVSSSKPWIGLFALMAAFTLMMLFLLVISFTKSGERLNATLEPILAGTQSQKLLGILFLAIGLSGFAWFTSNSYFIRILGNATGVRYLLVVVFCLTGMWGIKIIQPKTAWLTALLIALLGQSIIQLILFFFTQVTSYPFAMGWSETSRFYFNSLFL